MRRGPGGMMERPGWQQGVRSQPTGGGLPDQGSGIFEDPRTAAASELSPCPNSAHIVLRAGSRRAGFGQARPMGRAALAVGVLVFALLSGSASPAPATVTRAAVRAEVTGFVLPVPPPPVVLGPFAPPRDRYGAGHRGVDLAAETGTVVVAGGTGRVVYAGTLVDRGVVSVEHAGGLRTTYEPVTASVPVGAAVSAGRPIGTLSPGHPPCAPASCLHWGARLPDGTYLDPLTLLRPLAVRLWPWDGGADR